MVFKDKGRKLPPEQPIIETSNVKLFGDLAERLLDFSYSNCPVPMIGIIDGPPGTGKTIAASYYQSSTTVEQHALCNTCEIVTIPHFVTTRSIMENILYQIAGREIDRTRIRNSNRFALSDEVISFIQQRHLRLLIIDNGERLDPHCVEWLLHLSRNAACALLMIGHERILKVLEVLEGEIGPALYRPFLPLGIEEVVWDVLPQLVVPGWRYDPHQFHNRELGEKLWKATSPSLLRLRMVLQNASCIAENWHQETIDQEAIRLAFKMMALPFEEDR